MLKGWPLRASSCLLQAELQVAVAVMDMSACYCLNLGCFYGQYVIAPTTQEFGNSLDSEQCSSKHKHHYTHPLAACSCHPDSPSTTTAKGDSHGRRSAAIFRICNFDISADNILTVMVLGLRHSALSFWTFKLCLLLNIFWFFIFFWGGVAFCFHLHAIP